MPYIFFHTFAAFWCEYLHHYGGMREKGTG